jgi:hypothetical protein
MAARDQILITLILLVRATQRNVCLHLVVEWKPCSCEESRKCPAYIAGNVAICASLTIVSYVSI